MCLIYVCTEIYIYSPPPINVYLAWQWHWWNSGICFTDLSKNYILECLQDQIGVVILSNSFKCIIGFTIGILRIDYAFQLIFERIYLNINLFFFNSLLVKINWKWCHCFAGWYGKCGMRVRWDWYVCLYIYGRMNECWGYWLVFFAFGISNLLWSHIRTFENLCGTQGSCLNSCYLCLNYSWFNESWYVVCGHAYYIGQYREDYLFFYHILDCFWSFYNPDFFTIISSRVQFYGSSHGCQNRGLDKDH